MSMKVVFLKSYTDYSIENQSYKPFDEVYISRSLGRRLCQQEIAIPWSIKDVHAGYKKLLKEVKEKARKKAKAKPRKKPVPKRAVSKKAEIKEKAINGA